MALPFTLPADCAVTIVPETRVLVGRTRLPPTVIGAARIAVKRSPLFAVFVLMVLSSAIVNCVPVGIVMGGGGGGGGGATGAAAGCEAFEAELGCDEELGDELEEGDAEFGDVELLEGVDDLLQPPMERATARHPAMRVIRMISSCRGVK